MRIWGWLGLILTLAALGGGRAFAADGPSFSCARTTEIEAAICRSPELSAADRRMQVLFEAAKPGVLGNGSGQLDQQRSWLKARDSKCAGGDWQKQGSKSLEACIAAAYDDRLGQLAIAALLVSPKDSLIELKRINPRAAGIYEALQVYATETDPARRSRTVQRLLQPAFAQLDPDYTPMLKDRGELVTPAQAATSDQALAQFFDAQALFGQDQLALTWPCAVLAKRPGLIEGLGAFWGGSIDGQVPDSDCDVTLPYLKTVDALVEAVQDVQPTCEGTIRFSTWRDYAKLEDAIRLHRPEVWKPRRSLPAPEPDERRFRAAHTAAMAAARRELAAYYRTSFGAAGDAADRDAGTAVDALISHAFNFCD